MMSHQYKEFTEHIIHCHCHKVVVNNHSVFNKFLFNDSFKADLLLKLQKEKFRVYYSLFIGEDLNLVEQS